MYKKIIYADQPEAIVVINFIEERLKKGLYTLVLAIGLPGSGKTRMCCRLAELFNLRTKGKEEFSSENIVDNFADFVEKVKDAKPGDQIVIEEVSVLFPSRRAMTADNVNIGRVLDTCRKKRVIIYANAPILTSIDSHIRAMANLSIETLKINKTQGVVISKPLRLQTNPATGKPYNHRLQRKGRDVLRIYTGKSNEEVWIEYESKKDRFMDKLYEEMKMKARVKEERLLKDMFKNTTLPEVLRDLTPRELEVQQLRSVKKLNQTEIAKKLGLHTSRISRICSNINKKMKITKEKSPNVVKKGEGDGH